MNTLWTALMEPNRFPYCRTVARWPADRRRDHSAAGIQQPQVSKHTQGAKRGGYCGGPTAGESENLSVEERTVPGVGDLAPIFSSPLGRNASTG